MGALFSSNKSSQSTAQNTTQSDNRIVGGDGSTNFANSSNNSLTANTNTSNAFSDNSTANSHNITNITTTDFGTVQGTFDLIRSGQNTNASMVSDLLDTGESFFKSGIGFADHAMQGVLTNSSAMMRTTEQMLSAQNTTQTNATAAIKDAFTTAKSGEQKIMVGAALAIVAIVALRK